MPKQARFLPLTLLLLAACPPLLAQEAASAAAQAEDVMQVHVSELKNPLSLAASAIIDAQEAFQRRQRLAPGATLQFRLLPKGPQEQRPLELKIEAASGDRVATVPLGDQLTFALPSFLDAPRYKDGRLTLNRKKAQMEWWPHIRVPGAADQAVRLGNLRLECEVFWAASRSEMPVVARGMLAMVDLCNSQRVQLYVPAPGPLSAATVTEGGQTWPLKLGPGGWSYLAPLGEERLTDDSLVQLTFADDTPAPPPKSRLSLQLGMAKAPSQLRESPPPAARPGAVQ